MRMLHHEHKWILNQELEADSFNTVIRSEYWKCVRCGKESKEIPLEVAK